MANATQMPNIKPVLPAASAAPALERLKAFWEGRSSRQRMYLSLGLAAAVAVVIVVGQMMATPSYKPLMSGLEAADAQAIGSQLAAKKIPYTISPDGTSISVPAEQVDAARLEVASHDMPHSGRIGFEIFDKTSWGQTEFEEKVNYQRALEGELERTIQTMSNVKSARVHLVMATDSVFMDRERGAKASVTLRLRRGSLSREEIEAIQRLVSGAVDELKTADVTLVDADSNRSLGSGATGSGMGNDEVEQTLTHRLMATLTPIVGQDRLRASVSVEYDTTSSEENDEKYDPTVSVPLTMQHNEESATNGAGSSGGVPGTSSNVPGGKTAAAPANTSGQSSKSESATYGVNRTVRHIVSPAGRVRRVSAAIVVDDAADRKQQNGKWVTTGRKWSAAELKQITEVAQAAIGFDAARGDAISVQNLSFDHPQEADAPPPTMLDKARKAAEEYAAVLRYGALLLLFLLVYVLVLRPVQKRALAPVAAVAALPSPVTSAQLAEIPESPESLAKRALALKQQLTDFVSSEPDNSTTAVRAWLREDKA